MKTCNPCKETKEIRECYQTGRSHYAAWCKPCVRQASTRQADAGYVRERRKRLREERGSMWPPHKLTRLERLAFELFHQARKRCRRAGKPFDLTREWVEEAVSEFCSSHYHVIATRHPFRPSLDRLDHRRSYTTDNVRVVWLIENYARNTFTEEQLIEFCQRKLGLFETGGRRREGAATT